MNTRLITVFVLVTMIATAFAQSGQSPSTPKTTSPEDAERIETAEITKIDAKKKMLTVRTVVQNTNAPRSRQPQTSGQRRTRGGGGGGGRRGGGGTGFPFPGGGGGGRGPAPSSKNQGKQFKVIVSDNTTIKDDVTTISFGLLRVGDHITVHGTPKKGSPDDLQATEITVSR